MQSTLPPSQILFSLMCFSGRRAPLASLPPWRAEQGVKNGRGGGQSIRRQHESTPPQEPSTSVLSEGHGRGRRPHLPRIAPTRTSVKSEEIKPYGQLFENSVALQYLWVHIWSSCCPAEHHSPVEESCVYVTRWTITECYVPNSQCILLLLWAANYVRFRNMSPRRAGVCFMHNHAEQGC